MSSSARRNHVRIPTKFTIGSGSVDETQKDERQNFSFHFGQRSEREANRNETKRRRTTTDLVSWNGEPVVVQGGLFFEGPVKDFLDVVEAESANGRAGQSV